MNKLEKSKKIIREYFEFADCGLYNSRNVVGDAMSNIYEEDGLIIDICRGYSYFEVFGLSDEEFEELNRFYNSLGDWRLYDS